MVINEFFVQRTEAWFRIVIKEGLGFEDYWYRFEFAKSRGAIHFHSFLIDKRKSEVFHSMLDTVRDLLNAVIRDPIFSVDPPTVEELSALERAAASDYLTHLPEHFADISAEHPAGREATPTLGVEYARDAQGRPVLTPWVKRRLAAAGAPGFRPLSDEDRSDIVAGVDVNYTHIGNYYAWGPHEGLAAPTSRHALRLWPFEVPAESALDDLIDFTESACMHCCSSYCLRKKGKHMVCRMCFGNETKLVTARTFGKPATMGAGLIQRNGIIHLEAPRDHPRLVQGARELARGWGANIDMQVLSWVFHFHASLTSDTPLNQIIIAMCAEIFDLPDVGVNITQFFLDFDSTFIELTRAPLPDDDPEIVEQLTRNRSILSDLKEIYHTTPYLNKIDFIERLINYVVAYATKGELSAKDAAEMFRGIALGNLDDSTPLASLAHKLSLRVLKSRECPRPEITLALQGLNFYCSSRQVTSPFIHVVHTVLTAVFLLMQAVHVDLNPKSREVGLADAGDDNDADGEPVTVRRTALDRYLTVMNDERNPAPTTLSFFQHITSGGGYPVFSHGVKRPVWPFTEEYARSMLLLHKPIRALSDLKGPNGTYIDGLHEFLALGRPHVPDCLVRDILRARTDFLLHQDKEDHTRRLHH